MKQWIAAFASGLLFALALGLGGMTLPERILGFLDFTGAWDPTLLLFMGGAMGVFAVAYRLRLRRAAPFLAPRFAPVRESRVDARLLGGSALFGLGWGLAGYCPAPAIASVPTGGAQALVFTAAMLGGMTLFAALTSLLERRADAASGVRPTLERGYAGPRGRTPSELFDESCG